VAKSKTKLKPKSKAELQAIVSRAVEEAVSFIETTIAPNRLKAQRYFDGKVDIGEEEGRSKVVATKVRDTIRQIKPSLQRVFLSHEKPVEFVPNGPEDVAGAEQATKWAVYKFNQLGGYKLLRDAFHDALLKKKGFVKVVWETTDNTTIHSFTNLTEDQFNLIVAEDGVEVLEHSPGTELADDGMGNMVPMPVHDLKISRTLTKGKVALYPVPPEEFFINEAATGWDQFGVCGHRTDKTVSDIMEMGLDVTFDELAELGAFASSDNGTEEKAERVGYVPKKDAPVEDPATKVVTLTEAYMKVDVDGTGKAVLHRFILAGTKYKLLDWEPWDEVDFADFEIDPEPHSFWPRSVFDLISEDQDAATSITRGILDNIRQVNTPRTAVLEGQVNLDDLLNNEVGGVVRERVQGAVRDLTVPFVAGQTLPALQYLNDQTEAKTGVTRASTGLDPDALQSTTKAAVSATISAAAAQAEVMARNLAEGGLTRLFKLMIRLAIKHADRAEMIRLNGVFVPVDPRVWNAEMDMTTNVGLGTGREEEKGFALDNVLMFQQGVLQTYGPQNGLVTMTNVRNTVADRLALAGYRNADRYIQPMDDQREAALLKAQADAAAQQPQQPDQTAAYMQIEGAKVQQKAQADAEKAQLARETAQANITLRSTEVAFNDDRQRDKMAQDLAIAEAEMVAKYGVQMNTAQLKAEQAAPRQPGGSM
jgi:hypothetical protein